jgi:hypothetical protein
MRGLVLSLFPGADLLGRAFEAQGWCVVRGPDILWGGNVDDFQAIAGRFDGVIGGPPCQVHSKAARVGTKAVDKIPEFLRVVAEAEPAWAVMENVREAEPEMPGWQRVELLQHGYRVEQMQKDLSNEVEVNRHLRLEIETLKAPQRIEALALGRLKLVTPQTGAAVVIERVVPTDPPPASVVAKALE